MTGSTNRTRTWRGPVATAVAAALAAGALVELAPAPLTQAFAQEQAEIAQPGGAVSFADVVEQASPAVVNISVTKVSRSEPAASFGQRFQGMPNAPLEEFFGRFFEAPGFPPQAPRRSEGAGSGFVVDAEGYIVTNYHVVSETEKIVVTFADGEQLDAEIVGQDPKTDLALLKVEADRPLPFVKFGDSAEARIGEWVLAIGNPFGLGGTATAGIISARGRDIQSGPYDDYLQIDAPINRGNSGGPVFNTRGEVIGVNTAIFSPNGGNIGIGFAIPSNQAASVIAQLKEGGVVERGWLGVQIQDIDEDLAATLGLDRPEGALVASVVDDSPAAAAGIEAGDVVTSFGGRDVDSARTLSRVVASHKPGEDAEIEIVRQGERRTLEVQLGDSSDSQQLAGGPGSSADAADLGLRLGQLNDQRRAQLGLPEDVEGVVVMDVRPGSAAAEKGLRPGDVIMQVNQRAVTSVDDAVRELTQAQRQGTNALVLVRDANGQRFVAMSFS
ncbi:MAG: DegQ family serine endoprotease [Gammaproteobacteria bacterium]|nr:DegQ family serine endoprotease [Gammaproteobacteria bacterium]